MTKNILSLLILLTTVITSCETEQEKTEAKIEALISNYVSESLIANSDKLDKLEILSIDTITPKTKCYLQSRLYIERYQVLSDSINKEIEKLTNEIRYNSDMAKKYASDRNQFNTYRNKVNELSEKAIGANDLNTLLLNKAKAFNDSCEHLDATTFLVYHAHFTIQTSKNNAITIKDTFSAIITQDFKIIAPQLYLSE